MLLHRNVLANKVFSKTICFNKGIGTESTIDQHWPCCLWDEELGLAPVCFSDVLLHLPYLFGINIGEEVSPRGGFVRSNEFSEGNIVLIDIRLK